MSNTTIRVQRTHGFTVLPNDLLRDPRLTIKAKGVVCVILSLPPGWEYSVAGLCSVCHCGRDMMRGALRELEAAGYLRREQAHDEGGKFSGSRYVILDQSAIPEEPTPEPEGTPLTDFPPTVEEPDEEAPLTGFPSSEKPSSENPTQLNKEELNKDLINTPIAPKGAKRTRLPKKQPDWKPERFNGLWAYYPRGEAKQKAIQAWDRLQPSDEEIDAMARALERQIRSPEWQEGRYIPYLSTWLNQERWTDEERQPPPPGPGGPTPPDHVLEDEGGYYL